MNRKTLISAFMIILSLTAIFSVLVPRASAASVIITSFIPVSHKGKVGDEIKITGVTNTTGLLYRVWFGNTLVVGNTTATGTLVNATFKVPHLKGGNYTLNIQDVNQNINTTSWFYINTVYYIEARTLDNKTLTSPKQLQEGDSARVWLNVTGGLESRAYVMNVTVRVPSPANTTYWSLVKFNTTSVGDGYNYTAIYPTSFSSNAHTNLTGTYTLTLNKTALATNTFKAGLTNSTEYHRIQNIDIRATGYKPSETVALKILKGTTAIKTENITAQPEGLLHSNWTVPSDATIGTYTINITSISTNKTIKNPPDIQDFNIPGFATNITARNLAGEAVQSVLIKAYENGKHVANSTSNTNGLVSLNLETGTYLCNATYKTKKVGERTLNITGSAAFNITCNLTNLNITVASEAGVRILEVKVFLKSENLTLTTNVTGMAVAHSLLPTPLNTTSGYVLNASRYDKSFNVTTVYSLLVNSSAVAWFNVSITCPTLTLVINAVNAEGQPLNDATVKIQELIGGLYNEGKTDASGKAAFSFIFGKYTLAVYDPDGIKLNETTINLFQSQNVSILCALYGLKLSVKVTDYFGQPISDANIMLQREGMTTQTAKTGGNGTVTFASVTGGTMQVAVYIIDQTQPCEEADFYIDKSTTVEVKVGKYVNLAGMLVETSQFAIALIIILTIVVALILEVYRRRRFKPQKTENVSENK